MDTCVFESGVKIEIPNIGLDNAKEEMGVLNRSFVSEELLNSATSVTVVRMNSLEFTEVDLNDSLDSASNNSLTERSSSRSQAEPSRDFSSYPPTDKSCCQCRALPNAKMHLDLHAEPSIPHLDLSSDSPESSTCSCKAKNLNGAPNSDESDSMCLPSRQPTDPVFFQDLYDSNLVSNGVLLHFCSANTKSMSKAPPKTDGVVSCSTDTHLDFRNCEYCIHPPPSYRSIIEKTLADPPPAYQAVTGIEANINEIAEDLSKKRENNSRNWTSLTLPKSRRLVIAVIFVVILIIGGILVILAVFK